MAEQVLMSALSPTMEEGKIVTWLKQEGDTISSGDVLCEVETDKAAMEYETDFEGILLKIVTEAGTTVKIGQLIAVIGEKGEDISDLLVQDNISAGKKTESQPATNTASISKTEIKKDQTPPPAVSSSDRIVASPVAKKIAQLNNIDLSIINGTGPNGRIIKRDVESMDVAPQASRAAQVNLQATKTIPHTMMRETIAKRLSESKFTAPHFYLKLSVAVDELFNARKKFNAKNENKLSLNAFLMKFAAIALYKHRMVNASWQSDHIKLFDTVDIGLAVALDGGLMTPVVRDCFNKSISEINLELSDLINRARKGQLSPNEYTNATFTISNLGSFGIEEFTAIINPPGSAILAVGSTSKIPVFDEKNNMTVKQVMKFSLSCDHRVIDGAIGAAFLSDLKAMIQDPYYALIG